MKKYAKVVNEITKQCDVALGTDIEYYKSIGMTELDVEQAYNGQWYLAGYAPQQTEKERLQQQVEQKETEYGMTRWQREGILAQNSEYSQYTKVKAQEIEDLAEQLRQLEQQA